MMRALAAASTLLLMWPGPVPGTVAAGGSGAVVSGDAGRRADLYLSESGYSGGALVARGGEIILLKGYGQADRDKGIPFGPDTVFPIGSVTKQFTAAAVLKLEMEGSLRVEDPITRFFDNVPDDKKGITLHHLLTHSAGLESDFAASDFDPVGRDEYAARILASPLRTPPGSAYHYSNAGYSLLGAVVEKVSKKGYEEYLREHLFLPAGMNDTGYKAPAWAPGRIAQGYDGDRLWGTILSRPWAPDGPWWPLRANGGIHSTLGDMYRWHQALLGTTVLSEEAKKKAFTPHIEEGPGAGSHYGYGWAIFTSPWGGRLIAHDGGNRVYSADFRRYVDQGLVVITGANQSRLKAFKVSEPLARIAMGETVPPIAKGPAALQPLADTGRHARARAWLDAFNTGDVEAMRAFRAAHMTSRPGAMTEQQRDEITRRMFADLGRLTPEGAADGEEGALVVKARAAAGGTVTLTFQFEPGPEGKLAGLSVERGE